MSDSVRPHWRQPTRHPHPWDSPGKNTGVGCHFLLQCRNVKSESEVAQSCPTLRDPMGCSLPGSSVHGIFQARVLEWGAIAFSNINLYISVYLNLSIHPSIVSIHLIYYVSSIYLLSTYPFIYPSSYPSIISIHHICLSIYLFLNVPQ